MNPMNVSPAATPRPVPLSARPTYPALWAPPRVLLAEDDHEMRALVAETLRRDGYDVIELESGLELRQWLERKLELHPEELPDLVVTDIRMPGASGLEVLHWLRGREWCLPVIVITAFGDTDAHEEALRLGAVTLLDKPFDMDDLLIAARIAAEPS